MPRKTRSLGPGPTARKRATALAVLAVTFLLVLRAAPAGGQLRVVTYNTAQGPRDGMDVVLEAIGAESVNGIAKPVDVLVLQEQESHATTTQAIVDILNGIYGPGAYEKAEVDGDFYCPPWIPDPQPLRSGLIFNTHAVELVQAVAFGDVENDVTPEYQDRQTLRYQLRPVGYGSSADFYVYSNHYKAGSQPQDQDRRDFEATTLRANADALGQAVHSIYAGDYNIQSSNEASYQTLLAAGDGQAFDPINRPGDWHNSSALRSTHTQAPGAENSDPPVPPGLVVGGMDDRFDFQLVSGAMLDGEGLSYIPGSYHAFGNNGTHPCCNSPITAGSGAAPGILTALTQASDHLPVVADYQVPARVNVSIAELPDRVLVSAGVDVLVTVANTAPVVASNGADELDYAVTGAGAVLGAATGTVAALSGGDAHALALDTSNAGIAVGSVSVVSTSPSVAGGDFLANISATILDRAAASFQPESVADERVLDFGNVPVGSGAWSLSASVWNIAAASGFTAGLDLDHITSFGATATLITDLAPFSGLSAGSEHPFNISLDTGTVGHFAAAYLLELSDENLPGGARGMPLQMIVSGSVYLPADVNGDGQVNGLDVEPFTDILLDGSYNPSADMNRDHAVNGLDVDRFLAAVVGGPRAGTAVPEPATCGLLAVAALTVASCLTRVPTSAGGAPRHG